MIMNKASPIRTPIIWVFQGDFLTETSTGWAMLAFSPPYIYYCLENTFIMNSKIDIRI